MQFDVDLPGYHGPLDLLHYLIRREELSLEDVSLVRIIEQYIEFLDVLASLDLENISEFMDVMSQLIEMKANQVLPAQEEDAAQSESARAETMPHLVERLMQYKRFRDVASLLDEQSRQWQLRYPRMSSDLPVRRIAPDEQPIAKVEIWDLVSAFGRILKAQQKTPTQEIRYDDTPIHVYIQRIHRKVLDEGRVELQDLFEAGMHKSALVAMFLATLEMTRYHGLLALQANAEGPLWLEGGPAFPEVIQVAEVNAYDAAKLANSNIPVMPR